MLTMVLPTILLTLVQKFHHIFLSGFIHYVEFGWIASQRFNTPILFLWYGPLCSIWVVSSYMVVSNLWFMNGFVWVEM